VETVRVLVMGGLLRRNYHCTIVHGNSGRDILAGLSVDKAFEGGEHAGHRAALDATSP